MKTIATISTATESNDANDAVWVEKPPVEIVVSAWLTASKRVMPKTLYKTAQQKVRAT